MNLKNLKNIEMKMSPQTQFEAQIGFLIGILIGAISAWVMVIFFTPWQWYFKLFATIGSFGIVGSLTLALFQTIGQRRQYIEAKKIMDNIDMEKSNDNDI